MIVCILSAFEDSLSKDTGYSTRIYNLAKGLAKFGNEVHIIVPGDTVKYEKTNGLIVHKLRGFLPKKFLYLISRLLGIAKSTSMYFYDPIFIFRIGKIVRRADIVQIEQQSAGGFLVPIMVKLWKKLVAVDCHDVFQSLRVEHTKKIRQILETAFEMITYKFANAILTVSDKEKALLVSCRIRKEKIEVIPNGVDTKQFDRLAINVSDVKRKYGLINCHVVIFVGNMEYLPNEQAVELIATKIAPIVCKEIDNVKFLIVGRYVKKINSQNLIFTGVVDNVAELLAVSDLAIAPLLHGSGTRIKILEYLSCSLPVVSTTIGIEGLDVKNEVNIMIEDDMNNFAMKVIKLLKDSTSSTKLARAARELVVNKYDWRNISKRLDTVYEKLLS
jgi:glycosyltransferase involved in cell wall biosynthesis